MSIQIIIAILVYDHLDRHRFFTNRKEHCSFGGIDIIYSITNDDQGIAINR
jgi:hypothetical protein